MKRGVVWRALGFFFFLLLGITAVTAIGLSPSVIELDFEPSLQRTLTIHLLNSAQKPLNATLQLSGDLATYFTVAEGFFVLPPQSTKAYTLVMKLPATLQRPGRHVVGVHAVQAPLQIPGVEAKGIGATLSVSGEIGIRVPYPETYAALELDLQDVNEGETSTATIRIKNYGLEEIRQATATLEIRDASDTLLDTLTSSTITLPSLESDVFTLPLDSRKYGPGIFSVTAFADYDAHRTASITKPFRIGTLFANVTNYTHEIFSKKINLFEIHIENRWNNKLEQVHATLTLMQGTVPVGETLKTPSVDIPPWGRATVSSFIDATTLTPGLYSALITLYYHGKTTAVTVPVTVKKPFTINATTILIVLIVLLLLLDIVWILHRRREDA